jgi:hypothetical protein
MSDQDYVAEKVRRGLIGLSSRFIALFIYGSLGVVVGLAMAFTGAPQAIEESFGTWTRVALGGSAVIGGVLLLLGNLKSAESRWAWVACLLGTIFLALWATTLAITYFASTVDDGFAFVMPGEAVPEGKARLYIPLLYEHLFALFILHLVVLARLRPPRPVD